MKPSVGRLSSLLRAVSVAAAVFAVAAGVVTATALPAEAGYIGSQQFNMCGQKVGCPARLTTKPSNLVWWWVSNSSVQPWVVTVNEACDLQWNDLTPKMTASGVDYKAFRSRTLWVGGDCGYFGNGMYLLGTQDTSAGSGFDAEYTLQDTSTAERRKMRCQRMNSILGQYAGCVTHLDADVATSQSNEGEGWVTTNYFSIFRFVGGDFNLTPSQSGMQTWIGSSGGYKDVDPNLAFTHSTLTTSLTKKLDYLLGDKSHFPKTPTASRDCKSDYSDHCYLLGNHQY